jgi:putative toxin-antitoxin system antitoxin component (TIGR02293 family)
MRGVSAKRVKDLTDRGFLDAKQVFRLIPERTFNRRVANKEALKPHEADAVGRLLRLNREAVSLFRDAEFARKWLSLPNPALGYRIPNDLAETDAGAREVETILLRIAHGVYS